MQQHFGIHKNQMRTVFFFTLIIAAIAFVLTVMSGHVFRHKGFIRVATEIVSSGEVLYTILLLMFVSIVSAGAGCLISFSIISRRRRYAVALLISISFASGMGYMTNWFLYVTEFI